MRKPKKICFVSFDPEFFGGSSLLLKNFIKYLKQKRKKYNIVWVYPGKTNEKRKIDNIEYISIRSGGFYPIGKIIFDLRLLKFFSDNKFDLVNIHNEGGIWVSFLKKRKLSKQIISTFHGSEFFYYRNMLKQFGPVKKSIFFPILLISYLFDGFRVRNSDKIICVSEHVKKELESLYGKIENMEVIRTGVDLEKFKPRDKGKARKKLKLEKDKIYGLYVGRGGYWTKGLDKIINLSKEIYKLKKNYRLLIIGANREKVKHLLDEKFIIFLSPQNREKMPYYYNSADIFFNLSRYEGGAPTLVTSEAMASGCLIVTDKQANQEIIEDGVNGLIIENNYKKEAKRVLSIFKNKKKKKTIIKNALKTIKKLSLEKWGRKYLNIFLN